MSWAKFTLTFVFNYNSLAILLETLILKEEQEMHEH